LIEQFCIVRVRLYIGNNLEDSALKMLPHAGYAQKNGAVLIVNTIKTAPFVCVYPVFCEMLHMDVKGGMY
jgi:hypothetical protein